MPVATHMAAYFQVSGRLLSRVDCRVSEELPPGLVAVSGEEWEDVPPVSGSLQVPRMFEPPLLSPEAVVIAPPLGYY